MLAKDRLQNRFVLLADVGEQHALVRGESNARLQCAADFADRRLERLLISVLDAAVLDVQAIEPAAVPLFIPAHVVVEAADGDACVWLRQRSAVVLLDL